MPDWEQSGTHRFAEQDDVLLWELRGPVLLPDVLDLAQRNVRIRGQYGYVLILIDGTAAGTMVPEARRRLIEIRRADPDALTRSAVYGVGPLSRALAMMVSRAMQLVVKYEISIHLCSSESEARTWLDGERSVLQELAKAQPGRR